MAECNSNELFLFPKYGFSSEIIEVEYPFTEFGKSIDDILKNHGMKLVHNELKTRFDDDMADLDFTRVYRDKSNSDISATYTNFYFIDNNAETTSGRLSGEAVTWIDGKPYMGTQKLLEEIKNNNNRQDFKLEICAEDDAIGIVHENNDDDDDYQFYITFKDKEKRDNLKSLLEIPESLRFPDDKRIRYCFYINHEETPETLIKILNYFKKTKIITFEGKDNE